MRRLCIAFLLGFLLAPLALSAAEAPAGNWKIYLPLSEQGDQAPWLVQFENKDGKWSGKLLAIAQGVPPSKINDVRVEDSKLRFTLDLTRVKFGFEGNLPKDSDTKIRGSFRVNSNYIPGELESTTLTSLDNFAVQKHVLATKSEGLDVVRAAFVVLSQAAERKAKVEEVRKWAETAVKASQAYGPWGDTVGLDLAELLSEQKPYSAVALTYAQQAEKQLDDKSSITLKKRTLNVLAAALTGVGKADEAKKVRERSNNLPWVEPTKFAGRKAKSDRVVLVELFTGAQCPPCVAADLGFDALDKTFKPSEVVLLQYHLHIPGPDALTNADTESRSEFYGRAIEGTPSIFFNGKPAAGGGGGQDNAQGKYDEYLSVIAPLLEKPAKAKVSVEASRKDDTINIRANVSDLAELGPDVRLRLVLVQKAVPYIGRNGLPLHHHVVRAFPGGIMGLPLKEKTAKQTATVKLDELRKKLETYLTEYNKKNPFPTKDRPVDLENLLVVAFVQNDESGEILQAAQVDVPKK